MSWTLKDLNQEQQDLALGDGTSLPKVGAKGPNLNAWMRAQGLAIPADLYNLQRLDDHGIVIRTAVDEVFIETVTDRDMIKQIDQALDSNADGVFRIERQDASVVLSGAHVYDVLAQTCTYNFSVESFVMTSLAKVSCAVMFETVMETPVFRLWYARSYAAYMWETLEKIVVECGGTVLQSDAWWSPT